MIRIQHLGMLAALGGLMLTAQTSQAVTIGPLDIKESRSENGATVLINIDKKIIANPNNQTGPDSWEWNLAEPIPLEGGGSIDHMTVGFVGDPVILLSFTVTAGAVDTSFIIPSPILAVGFVGTAKASAGISITDNELNGALLTGLIPVAGGDSYAAIYNGPTIYALLVPSLPVPGAGDTDTSSGNAPFTDLGFVIDMQAGFSFKVSAKDSAAGTSRYSIVPTIPDAGNTLAMLAVGGLFLVGLRLTPRRAV